MGKIFLRSVALVVAVALAAVACAESAAWTYQGELRDAQGNALSVKSHTISFRLYSQAQGGSSLWGRKHDVLLDDDGLFCVELSDSAGSAIGDGTPATGLVNVLANNAATLLYLGISVDGSQVEISPRQKILASPYATCAADGVAASGDMAVSGGLSSEANLKVSNNVNAGALKLESASTVPSLKINKDATVKGKITVKGTVAGNGAFPIGGIMIWSGAVNKIPAGWALCDGNVHNNMQTPNLKDLFIVGAGGSYGVGAKGGVASVTLTVDQIPRHAHHYFGDDQLLQTDWSNGQWWAEIYCWSSGYDAESSKGRGNGWVYGTSYIGGDHPHENRPPFYALCYIMRVE